jgi:glycine/D-amino acid oxidase-like deaminating enzyme
MRNGITDADLTGQLLADWVAKELLRDGWPVRACCRPHQDLRPPVPPL